MVEQAVKHLVGGRFARSMNAKTFSVNDPVTGKQYMQVETGDAADVNQAILAAQAAFGEGPWATTTPAERAGLLTATAEAILARADEIGATEAAAVGLPVTQATAQVARAAEHFRRAAELITARPQDEPGEPGPGDFEVTRPAGISGVITSWRTPFLTQASAIAPALAAGCTVVLRPDEQASRPAMLLAEITTDAGLPTGVLNIIHGSLNPRVNAAGSRNAFAAHPAVARIWFAGDAASGVQVKADAARQGKGLRTELPGNSPCIVFADADLDQVTDAVLFGAFALNGQRATATSTILAERPVYDELVSSLAERARQVRLGDPSDPATEVGPLATAEHRDKVSSWVRAAIREGARPAAGGRRPASLPDGNYLEVTVLADVTPDMPVFAEYLCAPVLSVTPFDDEDEAVSLAKGIGQLPAVYLWTPDLKRANQLALALRAADTWVNSPNVPDARTAATPGQGGSAAEDAQGAIDFYTRSQVVHVAADDTLVPQFGA